MIFHASCILLLLLGTFSTNFGEVTDCSPCKCTRSEPFHGLNEGSRQRGVMKWKADCSNLSLKQIPSNLPSDIEHLAISGNNLGDRFLDTYQNLWRYNSTEILELDNTSISSLPVDIFLNSPKLLFLNLSGNAFTSAPEEIFDSTPGLLRLVGFDVYAVPSKIFHTVGKLRSLDLRLGQQLVPSELLQNATALKSLSLELKIANSLPGNLLTPAKDVLASVSIYGEYLGSLPEDFFKDVNLRSIILYMPRGRLPSEIFLQKKDGEFTSHISSIVIVGVGYLPEELFKGQLLLETLRLSYVGSIPPSLFDGLIRLDVLELSRNQLIQVKDDWLRDIGRGLKELDLSHNALRNVGENNFTKLESVTTLNLAHNQISHVHKDAFLSVSDTLVTFDASHNKICDFHAETFANLRLLEVLKLDHNCLSLLPVHVFRDQRELRELYLQNNNLYYLHGEMFLPLDRLEVLNISSSRVAVLPHNALRKMEGLRVLDFSNNSIEYLPLQLLPNAGVSEAYLGENPLHCDCSLVSFRVTVTSALTGVCTSPRHLAGKAVEKLDVKQLCESEVVLNALIKNNPELRQSLHDGMLFEPGEVTGDIVFSDNPEYIFEGIPDANKPTTTEEEDGTYVYSSMYTLSPRRSAFSDLELVYFVMSPLREEVRYTEEEGLRYYFHSSEPMSRIPPVTSSYAYYSSVPIQIVKDPRGRSTFAPPPTTQPPVIPQRDRQEEVPDNEEGVQSTPDQDGKDEQSLSFGKVIKVIGEAMLDGDKSSRQPHVLTAVLLSCGILAAAALVGVAYGISRFRKYSGSYVVNREYGCWM